MGYLKKSTSISFIIQLFLLALSVFTSLRTTSRYLKNYCFSNILTLHFVIDKTISIPIDSTYYLFTLKTVFMEKKFTLLKALSNIAFSFAMLMFATSAAEAQVACPNESVLWIENFGSGTTATSHPDVLTTGLTYQETGALSSEGVYRITNNTQQKDEWHASADHTGDVNGKTLVTNGQAETFYQHEVSRNGFAPGNYTVNLYLMNVDPPGVCSPNPLLTVMTFTVEYLSEAGTWVPFAGSPYSAAPVPQSAAPTWVNVGSSFTLPSTGSFIPSVVRITLGDGTEGGCGNDFAIDDVKFSLCPEGGPAPVEFINFKALQKENGISLEWSTAQEINNSYFEVQRSADGNSNWSKVATVNGAGNSQVIRNYSALDANPLSGINYYRVKQVDYDGHFKYSATVNVKTNLNRVGVSVLANPFYNTLSVNFASTVSQVVSARLLDITGKQVAIEKWSVTTGNTRKDFSNISGLQQGMYILSIRSNSGEILYNGKVVKQ